MAKFQMQKRERIAMVAGGIILLALLLFKMSETPIEQYKQSKTSLQNARMRLDEVRLWRTEILASRADQEEIEKRLKLRGKQDFFSAVNSAVRKVELTDRAKVTNSPRAKVTEVQLDLNGVSLKEVIDVVHEIHKSDSLAVLKDMQYLRSTRDNKGLDCKITLSSPK